MINWHRILFITVIAVIVMNQGCFERHRNCSVVVISTCED